VSQRNEERPLDIYKDVEKGKFAGLMFDLNKQQEQVCGKREPQSSIIKGDNIRRASSF
jgi:hypothetical protein